MILCGWCGHPTEPAACGACGRDPVLPYLHRDQEPQRAPVAAVGRPGVDVQTIRRRMAEARQALGAGATVAQLAEHLDVSVRTLGRWRKLAD